MTMNLQTFATRLVLARGLIRKNRGPSIVPLLIVHFTDKGLLTDHNPRNKPILITVDQRHGLLYRHDDLTKFWSMGRWDNQDHNWLETIDVVALRKPLRLQPSRGIVHISAQVNRRLRNEW